MKKIFIFDFDGVIVDSVHIKTEAFGELFGFYGPDIKERVINHHIANGGMSRFEKIQLYHRDFLGKTISQQKLTEELERFSNIVFTKVVKSKFIKGAIEIISFCRRSNIICGLNSATPEDELKKIIFSKGLDKNFQFIYGSPASKVENFKKIFRYTNTSAEEAIFFGDSMNDFIAASELNIDFVGINFQKDERFNNDFSIYNDFIDFKNKNLVISKS